jgi:hypothetical protein
MASLKHRKNGPKTELTATFDEMLRTGQMMANVLWNCHQAKGNNKPMPELSDEVLNLWRKWDDSRNRFHALQRTKNRIKGLQ